MLECDVKEDGEKVDWLLNGKKLYESDSVHFETDGKTQNVDNRSRQSLNLIRELEILSTHLLCTAFSY